MKDTPDKHVPRPADFPALFDIEEFNTRLTAAFDRINKIRPYKMESLGQVGGRDIFLLSPVVLDDAKPNILTAGGFHGNEPAGPWGILEFLETADEDTLKKVNHSFLPLVNPTGFERAERYNIHGENPNRGFVPEYVESEEEANGDWSNRGPSAEGAILLSHDTLLLKLAKHGFTSQHEDDGIHEGFIFINETAPQPSKTANAFLAAIQKYFPLIPDGGVNELEGYPIKGGMWVNGLDDSSYETHLINKGVPRTVTTETPSPESARARVDCNRDMVQAFADSTAELYATPKKVPQPKFKGPKP